ncbi:hypothetical protein [Novosphingobium sp.]|uniref:hypothetical protein n=1 Tax=Novosphingobium sp. TaxID=1874826 RepID=UPI0028A8C3B2|nr:hypothetical protein [Novosphingobium sp.]
MARWGTRIKNRATGSVQIDDLYANMALISKQTQSVPVSASATSPSYTQWVYSGAELPVLAFACTAPTFVHYVTRDNTANTWTFRIGSYVTGSAVNLTVYQFGSPPVLGPGWGMRIKPGGVVKYDSRHRYARVATTLRGELDWTAASGPSATMAAGSTYAVVMGNVTQRNTRTIQQQGGTQPGYIDGLASFRYGVAISGNALTSRSVQTYFSTAFFPVPPSPPAPSPYDYRNNQYSWAVLDVTNY